MVRNRGILIYVCVLALVVGGAGATLETQDESAAPVVQSWSADQGSSGIGASVESGRSDSND